MTDEEIKELRALAETADWIEIKDSAFSSLLDRLQSAEDALRRATDSIVAWGSYASDYFKDKHGFEGDLTDARAHFEKYGKDTRP